MKGFFTCDSLNNIWSGFGFKWRSIEWYEKELFKKTITIGFKLYWLHLWLAGCWSDCDKSDL